MKLRQWLAMCVALTIIIIIYHGPGIFSSQMNRKKLIRSKRFNRSHFSLGPESSKSNISLNSIERHGLATFQLLPIDFKLANQTRNSSLFSSRGLDLNTCSCETVIFLRDQDTFFLNSDAYAFSCAAKRPLALNQTLIASHQCPTAATAQNNGPDTPMPPPPADEDSETAATALLPGSDPACRRYIVADQVGHGLGHRVAVVAFAANLAAEFGYRLAASVRLWASPASAHGDDYAGLRDALGLRPGLPTPPELPLRPPRAGGAALAPPPHRARSREAFIADHFTRYRSECEVGPTRRPRPASHRARLGSGPAARGLPLAAALPSPAISPLARLPQCPPVLLLKNHPSARPVRPLRRAPPRPRVAAGVPHGGRRRPRRAPADRRGGGARRGQVVPRPGVLLRLVGRRLPPRPPPAAGGPVAARAAPARGPSRRPGASAASAGVRTLSEFLGPLRGGALSGPSRPPPAAGGPIPTAARAGHHETARESGPSRAR